MLYTANRTYDPFERHFGTRKNYRNTQTNSFRPNVDVFEFENTIQFNIELPGMNKSDIKLTVNDENVLTIHGTRKFDRPEATKNYRNEIKKGEFTRSFILPDDFDAESIDANLKNGILEVTVSKKEPVIPEEKVINII